ARTPARAPRAPPAASASADRHPTPWSRSLWPPSVVAGRVGLSRLGPPATPRTVCDHPEAVGSEKARRGSGTPLTPRPHSARDALTHLIDGGRAHGRRGGASPAPPGR